MSTKCNKVIFFYLKGEWIRSQHFSRQFATPPLSLTRQILPNFWPECCSSARYYYLSSLTVRLSNSIYHAPLLLSSCFQAICAENAVCTCRSNAFFCNLTQRYERFLQRCKMKELANLYPIYEFYQRACKKKEFIKSN
jgi:hypothetical protein